MKRNIIIVFLVLFALVSVYSEPNWVQYKKNKWSSDGAYFVETYYYDENNSSIGSYDDFSLYKKYFEEKQIIAQKNGYKAEIYIYDTELKDWEADYPNGYFIFRTVYKDDKLNSAIWSYYFDNGKNLFYIEYDSSVTFSK